MSNQVLKWLFKSSFCAKRSCFNRVALNSKYCDDHKPDGDRKFLSEEALEEQIEKAISKGEIDNTPRLDRPDREDDSNVIEYRNHI